MPVVESLVSGKWKISVIRAGLVRMDGGAIFGVVPKPLWSRRLTADDANRVTLAMNCLVVQNEDECILIETGFGGKVTEKQRAFYDLDETEGLLPSLAGLGIAPEAVTRVVLTHLHQDHAGGCTILRGDRYETTFAHATYYVQRGEWEDGEHADAQTVNGYRLNEVMRPLAQSGRVHLMDGSGEVCCGIRVMETPGHTRSHQSVVVETGEQTLCYIGDLIPTTHHLRPIYILAYDLFPRETFLNKQVLTDLAFEQNWILVWSHDLEVPWGRLAKEQNGDYCAAPIDGSQAVGAIGVDSPLRFT